MRFVISVSHAAAISPNTTWPELARALKTTGFRQFLDTNTNNNSQIIMANCTAADAAFGPLADSACRSQDFTLYFEQAIFALVPAAIFSIVFPARIAVLAKAKTAARSSWLRSVKLVSVFHT